MKRVLVIGCPCAGKTTFARKLAQQTGLPLLHLDTLFWRDGWQTVGQAEFDRLLQAELEKAQWIIDGNFSRTLPMRLSYCDTVIFLDVKRYQCMYRAFKRVFANYGKSREDMGGYCPEKLDREKWRFFKSIWQFKKEGRPKVYERLKAAPHAQVIVLKTNRDVRVFLANQRMGVVVAQDQ